MNHRKVNQIVKQVMAYEPEKVILFGSYASGKSQKYSDVDLVVIKKTKDPFNLRLKKIRMLLKTTTPVDVFVFTPQEFREALTTNLLVSEIARSGKVIYG